MYCSVALRRARAQKYKLQAGSEVNGEAILWSDRGAEFAEFAMWITVLPGEGLTDDTIVVLVRNRKVARGLAGADSCEARFNTYT